MWVLVILVGWIHFYSTSREFLSGKDSYKKKIEKLQVELKKERMKTLLSEYRFRDFTQSVAVLLPTLPDKNQYPQRNLASVVSKPDNDQLKIEFSSSLLDQGKKFFREEDFFKAISLFKNLIQRYPSSVHAVEAYFLLVESYLKVGEIDECISTIDTMVQLYPENDLTGFALIRLGELFAKRERMEDAQSIFQTILNSFENPELRNEARTQLERVSL